MGATHSSTLTGFFLRLGAFSRAAAGALCLPAIAALLLVPVSLGAADCKVLYSFSPHSAPASTLVQGRDGAFYGTTGGAGAAGYGSVYRITPDGVFSNLFSFGYTNGDSPNSPLVRGDDGAFYGTTSGGGPSSWFGTVFRLTTNGTLTTLAVFSGPDGAGPSALVRGVDGSFYGTTGSGGSCTNQNLYGDGTVFRVTTNGVLTSLAFFSGTNGWSPNAGLVQGRDGALYGTTLYGGPYTNGNPNGNGTIFKVTTNGVLTPLVCFTGTNGGAPPGPLALGQDGMLYGIAEDGGANGWGTVFRVSPEGTLTTLVNFQRYLTGVYPWAGLVQGRDGAFYGTTTQGSFAPDRFGGTVFRITTNGLFSGIYSFAEPDGRWPETALTQGSDGAFYGTCVYGGGPQNAGTIFRLDLSIQLLPPKPMASGMAVSFPGLPDSSYWVQRATNPLGPWDLMATVTADTNGAAAWLDPSPPLGQAFYRAAIPQAPQGN